MKKLGAEFVNITQMKKQHYHAECFFQKTIRPENAVPEWSVFFFFYRLFEVLLRVKYQGKKEMIPY